MQIKQIILAFLCVVISSSASAYWRDLTYSSQVDQAYPGGCDFAKSDGRNVVISSGQVVYFTGYGECQSVNYGSDSRIHVYYKRWEVGGTPDMTGITEPVHNMVYTDAQCALVYGEGSVSTGQMNDSQTGEGACEMPPSGQDLADQECEAIKPTFITLSSNPGGAFSWEYAGCSFTSSAVWLETPSGEWSATVNGAVAVEPDPETVDETVTEAPPAEGRDASGDYQATTDPSLECPFSNVSYDGTSYCYSGDDAPAGAEYADGSTRVNHWDGSYTVTDSEGVVTEFNRDGSLKGTASTSAGSVGPGTDGSGCPSWAPDWMCGDGLVEDVDPGAQVDGIGIDGAWTSIDGERDATGQAIDDALGQVGDVSGSSSLLDPVTSKIPSLPGGGCTPFEFDAAGHAQVSIPCDGVNLVQQILTWLFYFWTVVAVVNIFLDRTTRARA